MLTTEQKTMVIEHFDLVALSVNTWVKASGRWTTRDEREELAAEASKTLVECVDRWPAYCAEHGYDPARSDYFRAWAMRRLKGAFIDYWRRRSPLSRSEVSIATEALRNGVTASAVKHDVTGQRVMDVMAKREALQQHDSLTEATPPLPTISSLWESLHEVVTALPQVARAWITLVYVNGLSATEARSILGLDEVNGRGLATFVEHRLIGAVLDGAGE